jgi:very-short-patch-repair endonuclease
MNSATAAVHAVLWARTDRQAALIALMAGQQRLFTLDAFNEEVEKIRWAPRRSLLRSLRDELAGGIEALGERDFATMVAKRGLPTPDRQVRRQTEGGRWLWDNVWDTYRVRAEVDGSQHLEPKSWMNDALKQNAASLDGHVVLRIPNIALRLDPDPFLDQLEAALRRGGWSP